MYVYLAYLSCVADRPIDNVGDDCPVFDGLFDYCAISAGGSMGSYL
jgi:hypothetical protein